MSLLRGQRGERGRAGERGQAGDHGQDGRDGKDSDVEFEKAVAYAVGEALGERRHWLWNRQMAATFLLLVLGFALLFMILDRQFEQFRAASIANCRNNNAGNAKVNTLLDQLAVNALTNTARLPQERKEIASTYRGLRLPISKCPP